MTRTDLYNYFISTFYNNDVEAISGITVQSGYTSLLDNSYLNYEVDNFINNLQSGITLEQIELNNLSGYTYVQINDLKNSLSAETALRISGDTSLSILIGNIQTGNTFLSNGLLYASRINIYTVFSTNKWSI